MALSVAEQKAYAFTPRVTSAISFMSAAYVICLILSDPNKRNRVYHRLVLGMCINSIIQSFAYFWSAWAFPKGTPESWEPMGTVATCRTQGFLVQFGQCVPFYYTSLSLYSFLAVRSNFCEESMRKVEVWIHVAVYSVPFTTALAMLLTDNINPGRSVCWIHAYPLSCEDGSVPCIRGSGDIGMMRVLFGGLPMFCFLSFATFMMLRLYRFVRNIERQKEKMVGKTKFLQEARHKKSRIVARQALMYLMAFYATYAVAIFTQVYTVVTGKTHFPTRVAGNSIIPLQAFFYMIVYIHLLSGRRQKRVEDFCPGGARALYRDKNGPEQQSQRTAKSGMSQDQDSSPSSNSEEKDQTSEAANRDRYTFSIFDGSNPSMVWRDFIIDDDDDDDDGGNDDNGGARDIEGLGQFQEEAEAIEYGLGQRTEETESS